MKPKKFNLFNDEGILIYPSSKEFYADLRECNESNFVEIEVQKTGLLNYKDGKKIVPAQYSKFRFEDNFIIGDKKKGEGATIFNKDGKPIFEIVEYDLISPDLISVLLEDGEGAILNHQLEILQKGIKAYRQNIYFHEDRCIVKNNNSKYGYIDLNGSLVIEPTFDFAENFVNGKAVIKINDKKGYIDYEGNIIIDPNFEQADKFVNGRAAVAVYINNNLRYGLINEKGNFIVEPTYNRIKIGPWNSAIIELDRKYGLTDFNGDVIVKPMYDNIEDFDKVNQKNVAKVRFEEKYGLIDDKGNIIFEPVYDEIEINENNENAIVIKDRKYGVVNLDKEEIIPCVYNHINSFSPDETNYKFYEVENDGKYGLISDENQIIIPFNYNKYLKFLSPVLFGAEKENGRLDIYSSDGKKLFDREFKDIKFIGENLILCDDILINKEGKILYKEVRIPDHLPFINLTGNYLINISLNNVYGYINNEGKIKIEPQFSFATPFHNGFALVKTKEDKMGVIDQTGKFIIDPIYDSIWEIDENLWGKWIVERAGDSSAVISKEAKIIFEEKNVDLRYPYSKSGVIEVTENGKIGFINLEGEFIVKPVYDEVEYFKEGVCPVSINGYWGLINDQGKEIVPPSFKRVLPHKWGKLSVLESFD